MIWKTAKSTLVAFIPFESSNSDTKRRFVNRAWSQGTHPRSRHVFQLDLLL